MSVAALSVGCCILTYGGVACLLQGLRFSLLVCFPPVFFSLYLYLWLSVWLSVCFMSLICLCVLSLLPLQAIRPERPDHSYGSSSALKDCRFGRRMGRRRRNLHRPMPAARCCTASASAKSLLRTTLVPSVGSSAGAQSYRRAPRHVQPPPPQHADASAELFLANQTSEPSLAGIYTTWWLIKAREDGREAFAGSDALKLRHEAERRAGVL